MAKPSNYGLTMEPVSEQGRPEDGVLWRVNRKDRVYTCTG